MHKLEPLKEVPGRTHNCFVGKCHKPAVYIYNRGFRDSKQMCLPHASECAKKYGLKLGDLDGTG
jgi:hypothetical protein